MSGEGGMIACRLEAECKSTPRKSFFEELYKFRPEEEKSNRPCGYLLCNETNQTEALNQIEAYARRLPRPGGVHIGFSSWFNFDLLSVMSSTYAIILDIDPKLYFVHEKLSAALIKSERPDIFIDNFLDSFSEAEENILPFPKSYLRKLLEAELVKGRSFLSQLHTFNRIRTMCSEKRIFFGCADITDHQAMEAVANWCRKRELSVDTIYISNISEWLLRGRNKAALDKMVKILKRLKARIRLLWTPFILRIMVRILGRHYVLIQGCRFSTNQNHPNASCSWLDKLLF